MMGYFSDGWHPPSAVRQTIAQSGEDDSFGLTGPPILTTQPCEASRKKAPNP